MRVKKSGDGVNMPPQKKQKTTNGQQETSVPSTVNIAEKESTIKAPTSNWREAHCNRHLQYAHSLMCNVTFEVEGREFQAHKLILAMASPVFEAMFYGGLAEKGDRVVITDLTVEGFKALLGCIYTNKISISTMEEGFQLWVAADKYCAPHVKAECNSFFATCPLTFECAWTTLETALFFDIDHVAKRCFGYLEDNAEAAMFMEDFTKMSVEVMTSFLSLDSLTASELSLMRGLVKWGTARISGQAEITLKQAVEPCLKFIRFGAMTIEDFCKVLDESNVFSDGDALAILKHLAKPHYPLPEWCCKTSWKRCSGDDVIMPPQKKRKKTNGQRETFVPPPANNAEKKSTITGPGLSWGLRLQYLQNHDLMMCDVTFEVEGREFKAHKGILAIASPVFDGMFYKGRAEKGDRVVITDLTAEGFKALLKYFYIDKISISTMDEGFQLWVAADKYCVPYLKTVCESFFATCPLTAECVRTTFQTAFFLGIDHVTRRCLENVEDNSEMFLEDIMNVEAIRSFLTLDSLPASELTLMRGLVKWGKARINGQEGITLKQALEPCLKFIRFGAMIIEDFCKVLDESNVFSEGDALAILKHLAKPHYPLPEWCCKTPWKRCRTVWTKKAACTNKTISSKKAVSSSSGDPSFVPSRPAIEAERTNDWVPDSGANSSSSDSDDSSASSCDSESSDSSISRRRKLFRSQRRRLKIFKSLIGKLCIERFPKYVSRQVMDEYLAKQKLSEPFTSEEINSFLDMMTDGDQFLYFW